MAWSSKDIQEFRAQELARLSYAVRHSDPPVSTALRFAPNVTVSQRELSCATRKEGV